MPKILIVEDDIAISDLIKMNLDMYGFTSIQAKDGLEGFNSLSSKPDLVILDVMLPKISGYELLPEIKKHNIPVIMLTAKTSLKSKIEGFNLGADDYMIKPFENLELISRINAVLRRNEPIQILNRDIQLGEDIKILVDSRKVIKDGIEIELTRKEFDLLHYFILNKGIALSRETLLEKIWNYDFAGNTRTVDMHVQKLRCKLNTNLIETVYKFGYRFDG